jgi:hypothetical protein
VETLIERIATELDLPVKLYDIFAPGGKSFFVQLDSTSISKMITFEAMGGDRLQSEHRRPLGLQALPAHPSAEEDELHKLQPEKREG